MNQQKVNLVKYTFGCDNSLAPVQQQRLFQVSEAIPERVKEGIALIKLKIPQDEKSNNTPHNCTLNEKINSIFMESTPSPS